MAKSLKMICREDEARKSKRQGREEEESAYDITEGLSMLGNVQELTRMYDEGNG